MALVSRTISGILKDSSGTLLSNLEFRISALSPYGSDGTLVGTQTERVTTNGSGFYSVDVLTVNGVGAYVSFQCSILQDSFQFDLAAGLPTSLDSLYNLGVVAGSSSAATLAELISGKADQSDLDNLDARVVVLESSPGSGSGTSFLHTQGSPATEWIINHNLGFKPSVEIIDTGGREVETDVLHISVNQVRIYFLTAMAGEARCV